MYLIVNDSDFAQMHTMNTILHNTIGTVYTIDTPRVGTVFTIDTPRVGTVYTSDTPSVGTVYTVDTPSIKDSQFTQLIHQVPMIHNLHN